MKTLFLLVLLIAPITTSFEAIPAYTTPTVYEELIAPEDYEKVILETLWQNGVSIDLSYIILSQAKHESADFQSYIFKNTYNLFGMKISKKRKTTAIGSFKSYAKYKSVKGSVLDYVYYMRKRKFPQHERSVYEYTLLLKKKRYFEDSVNRYYNGVLHYKKILYK